MLNRFIQFYPGYLLAHSNRGNRVMHFAGASFCIALMAFSLSFLQPLLFVAACVVGYLFPHIGHRRFEKNHSMRLSHPFFCVLGAILMYLQHWSWLITRLEFPETMESPFLKRP